MHPKSKLSPAESSGRFAFQEGKGKTMPPVPFSPESGPPVQMKGGNKEKSQASWLEQKFWLSFFDQPLPRKLLKNYMKGDSDEIELSLEEMKQCNPKADIRKLHNGEFWKVVKKLRKAGGGTHKFNRASGEGAARTNGTLGNFNIFWTGTLEVHADGGWNFHGDMEFYDEWDFDPKPFKKKFGRSSRAEIKVRAAHYLLRGEPFKITSKKASVAQSDQEKRVFWGHKSKFVPDDHKKVGADVVVGGAAGDALGAYSKTGKAAILAGGDVGAGLGPFANEDTHPVDKKEENSSLEKGH